MVTKKLAFLLTMLCFYLSSYSYQQNDTLTYNHKELTFESPFLNIDNNNLSLDNSSASFSYLFKLNKRFELGPQLYIASYNTDNLGRFYPLALRAHIKFYFGDLIYKNKESKILRNLYATSKLGLAYELKDQNFINSDQYILGIGTKLIHFKNKKTMNLEVGVSEVALNRNNTKFVQNLITFGVNFKL